MILSTVWWLQKVGKDLSNNQAVQVFDVERFNHRKLNELDVKKHYQIAISNMFAAFRT